MYVVTTTSREREEFSFFTYICEYNDFDIYLNNYVCRVRYVYIYDATMFI